MIQRILIVTKFRFIGDTLLAIPIFRAARQRWPDAKITLLTGKNARQMLEHNPYLDEIIEFEPTKSDQGLMRFLRVVTKLRHGQFDICLSLNRSFHSALMPWLAGIKVRAGFDTEGRGRLLNRRLSYDHDKSEIECYFDVLRSVAPETPIDSTLELWISASERKEATERIREAFAQTSAHGILIGIQPGASLLSKRWSAENFARVADGLAEDDPGTRLVLIGGPDEIESAREMLDACSEMTQARIVSFVGKSNLRASLALIAQLDLFIGNDTAVMHSAVALGDATVALFGPTNPHKWGSFGPRQRVIESPDGTMDAIPVQEVLVVSRAMVLQTSGPR